MSFKESLNPAGDHISFRNLKLLEDLALSSWELSNWRECSFELPFFLEPAQTSEICLLHPGLVRTLRMWN